MAYRRNKTTKRNKKIGKNGSDYNSLAFKLGRIETGLLNPNSQVCESYNKGKAYARQKKDKKPMF